MRSLGSLHAGAGRMIGAAGNPFARPAFEVVFEDAGISAPGGSYANWTDTITSEVLIGGGTSPVSTWRGGKRAVEFGARSEHITAFLALSAVTARTWYFALRIPPNAGAFSGVGPTSTANTPNKNFPIAFKSGNVITTQPATSNRDSSLDMSPYYGLDAIISVRQAAAGIRFSMRIEGVSGRVVTTAAGEAAATDQAGWSAGGWYGGGGGYPYPIALMGVVSGALSDADQDEGVDWAAWEYDLITP